jgi:hypothetical protein
VVFYCWPYAPSLIHVVSASAARHWRVERGEYSGTGPASPPTSYEVREFLNQRVLDHKKQRMRACSDFMQVHLSELTHLTFPAQCARLVKTNPSPLLVYLRPSTVSITVTSRVLDVLAVLDVVVGAGGAGAGAPLVGISPARAVMDISPVKAIAKTKRFIF